MEQEFWSHSHKCIVHQLLLTNDRINQIKMPTVDQFHTRWFFPQVLIDFVINAEKVMETLLKFM